MILLISLGVLLAGGAAALRRYQRQRHQQLLQKQLRQSLQGLVHCLQTGRGFLQAVESISRDIEPPLADEWRRCVRSVQTGRSIAEALRDLQARVPIKEMTWFASAARITQETGGSLSGVLENLALSLRERETLREKIAALTAQGKASGALLSLLPFLMMAALYLVAPAMVEPLFTTPSGHLLLAVILLLITLGAGVILKIVSIDAE